MCMDTYESFMIQKCTFMMWFEVSNIFDFLKYTNDNLFWSYNINAEYVKHLWYGITNSVML